MRQQIPIENLTLMAMKPVDYKSLTSENYNKSARETMSDRSAVITIMQQSNEDGIVLIGGSEMNDQPMKLMAT